MKWNRWYFYQDRKLVLNNEPWLMYFTGDEYRGDIQLSKDLWAELIGSDWFDLVNDVTKMRKYFRVY